MKKNIRNLNSKEFFNAISSNETTLVDFWAPWCGPCQMMAPIMENLSHEIHGINIAKVNIDEEPEISARFKVRGIPTLMLFKDGNVIDSHVGFSSSNNIKKWLRQKINS